MSVRIENLHVGDYVTVYQDLRDIPPWQRIFDHFVGLPHRVLAVCYPFVALADARGEVHSLDLRAWGLTKLTEEYVAAMMPAPPSKMLTRKAFPGQKRKRRRRVERDERDCPRCGCRLVQTIRNDDPERRWRVVCPECGFDQGPVEVET